MCIKLNSTRILTSKKPITAYKAVQLHREGKLLSFFPPHARLGIPGLKSRGVQTTYKIGKTHKATFGKNLGFYCFTTHKAARAFCLHNCSNSGILKVTIPAGTPYVRGRTATCCAGLETINCASLIPVTLL